MCVKLFTVFKFYYNKWYLQEYTLKKKKKKLLYNGLVEKNYSIPNV